MTGATLFLLASSALPQVADAGPRLDLLSVLRVEDPARRERSLRDLIRRAKRSLPEWRELLAKLAQPPLPIADLETGRVLERTLRLWTGKKTGILATKVGIYLPEAYETQRRLPLLLASHGTGGTSAWQLGRWRRTAASIPMIVLAATEQGEDGGYRFSEQERQTQISLLRWALLHLSVDPDRVFLTGASRGGHLVWDVGTRHPDRWAGLVPCIGGPYAASHHGRNNLRLIENLVDMPIRDLQGEKDDPGLLWNLRYAFRRLAELGARDAELLTFPELGHGYRQDAVDWPEFFGSCRRDPTPSRIRFSAVRLGEARCHWIRILGFDRKVKSIVRMPVPAGWNRMKEEARRHYVLDAAYERTAHLKARLEGPEDNRKLIIQSRNVKRVRVQLPLLLVPGALESKGPVLLLDWNGRRRRIRLKPNLRLLLSDYCQRLDLRSAPVVSSDLRL